jgi:hypothetical protein
MNIHKITFKSRDTFVEKIPSVPIEYVENGIVQSDKIEKLSNEKQEVFDDIKKIRASRHANYSDKRRDEVLSLDQLKKYLKRFGEYKIAGKLKIINKLIELYEMHNASRQDTNDNYEDVRSDVEQDNQDEDISDDSSTNSFDNYFTY